MLKQLRTFSATGFQIVFNQVLGLAFFLLMAAVLTKEIFGELNWAVAVTYTITVMCTFGFDHVVVRRIAAGSDAATIAGTYLSHALLLSVIALVLLWVHRFLFPAVHELHQFLTMVFCGGVLSFLSGPFKQLANGRERFWHLAFMNVSGNLFRVAGMLALMFTGRDTAQAMGLLFLLAGLAEFLTALLLTLGFFNRPLLPVFNPKVYGLLLKEALPSLGAVLLESAFARMDWILLGLLSTSLFTAEYSFAYKAYDSSRLPLLIIAPVLLPKMARLYNRKDREGYNASELIALWKGESIVSVIIPLVLTACWTDLIDLLTAGKYGQATFPVYVILSLALPMLYITNFLWTVAFTQKRFNITLRNSAAVMISNLVLNLILIPRYHAIGAALAATISLAVQMVLYILVSRELVKGINYFDFVKTSLLALAIGLAVHYIPVSWLLRAFLALGAYGLICYLSGMLNFLKQPVLKHQP